jgi:hypothetical protein
MNHRGLLHLEGARPRSEYFRLPLEPLRFASVCGLRFRIGSSSGLKLSLIWIAHIGLDRMFESGLK